MAEQNDRAQRFGQLLKERRESLGLKQQEVADQAGMHLSTYSRWERGLHANPMPEDVQAVCKVLRLSTITAGLVLGFIAPDEAEQLPEPPRRFDPLVEDAIAILEDPQISEEAKKGAHAYLEFLAAKAHAAAGEQADTRRGRAAS